MARIRYFVYGTLKRGFPNYREQLEPWVERGEATFLYRAQTVREDLRLICQGIYRVPFLVPAGPQRFGFSVDGEVFEVSEEARVALDRFEGPRYSPTRLEVFDLSDSTVREEALTYVKTEIGSAELCEAYWSSYTRDLTAAYVRPSVRDTATVTAAQHSASTSERREGGEHLLFVYGTLREGFANHKFLQRTGAERVVADTVCTVRDDLRLVVFDEYFVPFLLADVVRDGAPGVSIKGELYRVDDRALLWADRFEGDEYRRALLEVTPENGGATGKRCRWVANVYVANVDELTRADDDEKPEVTLDQLLALPFADEYSSDMAKLYSETITSEDEPSPRTK